MLPRIAISPQDCIVLQNVKGKLSLELGYTREKMQIGFWHCTVDETQAKSALHFLKIFGSESKLQKCLPLGTREQGIGIWRTREKNERAQPRTSYGSALDGIMLLSRTRITGPAPQTSVREEGYCL